MRHAMAAAAAALSIVLATNSAHAGDDPTDALVQSRVVVGIERAVSFVSYESATVNQNGSSASSTASVTGLSILAADPAAAADVFYVVPRLAVDAVLVAHLTLGGAIFFWTDVANSVSTSLGGSSVSLDNPKRTYWGLAPRVGYIAPLGPTVALWPRAGVEYHNLGTSTVTNDGASSGGESLSEFAMDLEANLVVAPFDHIGFTLTLYGAIPLSGSVSGSASLNGAPASTSVNGNVSETAVGLTAGMLAFF
jgi:hypothetical protein